MGEPETRSAADALAATEEMRARSIAGAQRPLWQDIAFSTLLGGALAMILYPPAIGGVIAIGLFCAAGLIEIVQHRRVRIHTRRILDDRSVGASFLHHLPLALVVPVLSLVRMAGVLPPPWLVAVCWVAAAAATLAYLRLTQRYQARRLRSGDHGRYDVL